MFDENRSNMAAATKWPITYFYSKERDEQHVYVNLLFYQTALLLVLHYGVCNASFCGMTYSYSSETEHNLQVVHLPLFMAVVYMTGHVKSVCRRFVNTGK